ncbi:DifB protein [Enhygromyxa salina]|uniref:DifB protein n=1 Tax=Enhygromyxa salina TaxID=215803 RepID=A0A0C2D9V1_9BACT|nr:DifB protein [Enhygromyxa salina]
MAKVTACAGERVGRTIEAGIERMAKAKKKGPHDEVLLALRAFGMRYPGVHYKSPWPGHMDLAVNDKTFAYLSLEGEPLNISCKLPRSKDVALMLPNTKPTAYGLGRSGWVSASFEDGLGPDLAMLQAWIDESYRAQAPKRLIKQLDGDAPAPVAAKKKAAKKKAAKKKAAKK